MNINPQLIFLVEDDPLIVRLYERMFKLHQYNLRVINNGEDAITALSTLTELPALILLDVMMPKLSGYDVLKYAKEQEGIRAIPIIMLTNLASKEDQLRALEMGAAMYIIKSQHSPKELMAIIQDFLAK
jgi:two-component system sensor histidine kinase ChiS